MTQKEHDELHCFAKKHFNRIFGSISGFSEKEPIDFFYDAYAEQPVNIYKYIVKKINEHYFRCIGKIQRSCKEINSYEKKCNRCKVTFDSSNFYQLYNKKYEFKHLASYCKKCCSEKSIEDYRNIESYREKQLKRSEKYRKNNPEKVAKTRAYSYEKNKEKQLALSYEKRRLSTEWWQTLTDELKLFYLEKYGFKTANRNLRLKAYRDKKLEKL